MQAWRLQSTSKTRSRDLCQCRIPWHPIGMDVCKHPSGNCTFLAVGRRSGHSLDSTNPPWPSSSKELKVGKEPKGVMSCVCRDRTIQGIGSLHWHCRPINDNLGAIGTLGDGAPHALISVRTCCTPSIKPAGIAERPFFWLSPPALLLPLTRVC